MHLSWSETVNRAWHALQEPSRDGSFDAIRRDLAMLVMVMEEALTMQTARIDQLERELKK